MTPFLLIISIDLVLLMLLFLLLEFSKPFSPYLLIIPVAVVPFFIPHHYIEVDVHNFIYSALTYATQRGPLPPECPFMAGFPANFPWAQNYLYCHIAMIFHTSFGVIIRSVGVICLIISISTILILVRSIPSSPSARIIFQIFSIFFGFFGSTLFSVPLPMIGLACPPWETRGAPVVLDYQMYTFPVGLTFGLIAYTTFILYNQETIGFKNLCMITITTFLSGLFYPFSWLGLMLAVSGSSVCLIFYPTKRNRLIKSLAAVALGTVLVIPYILSIRHYEAEGAFKLNLSILTALFEFRSILFQQGILLGICLLGWRYLAIETKYTNSSLILMLSSVMAIDAFSLVVIFPEHTEYKIWVYCSILLGISSGKVLSEIYFKYQKIVLLCAGLLLLPFSLNFYRQSFGNVSNLPAVPFFTDGPNLVISDYDKSGPYLWIANNTPTNSVILEWDTVLAPVMARRSLFLGRNEISNPVSRFGISMPIQDWISRTCALGKEAVKHRESLLESIFGKTDNFSDLKTTSDKIKNEVLHRPVYVIARNEQQNRLLYHSVKAGILNCAASGNGWAVYAMQ